MATSVLARVVLRFSRSIRPPTRAAVASVLLALLTNAGCAVKKIAVNKLGDAIASGGMTYASDDDPELVREAVPFSLKLMESLQRKPADRKSTRLNSSHY